MIVTALSLTFGVLGLLLVLLLFRVVRTARDASRLDPHRYRGEGTADLLNYAALIEDGIVVGKDGALMAAWRYSCADSASSTEAEQEQLSAQINRALQSLGNGWMLHVDAVRQPAPSYGRRTGFPDPVTAAIDDERRRFFEAAGAVYEGHFILTVTYLPPAVAERRFVELMFDDDAPATTAKERGQHLVAAFKRDIRALESRLPLKLERLRGHTADTEHGQVVQDDFLRWLHYCTTGLTHPIALPRHGAYLDLLIGGQDLWGGLVPKIGRHFLQVVSIDGFPLESYPGMLNALAELPCDYRWSTRFIFLDPHEATAHLERYRKKWRQKVRGLLDQVLQSNTGAVDQDALDMVHDAEAAISEVNSGLVAQGYYTSVVVLMDESRDAVTRAAEQTYRVVTRLGFAARIEDVNTLEAWLGSLPGHGVQNVRRPLLNSFNLADLLPTSTIWAGEHQAPCLSTPPPRRP